MPAKPFPWRLGFLALFAVPVYAQTTVTYSDGDTATTTFLAGTDYVLSIATGTATENSDYAGGASITKVGGGDLILTGTFSNSGGTFLQGGLLEFTLLGPGGINFQGGGLRWAPGVATDVSDHINPWGSASALFDTNGNQVTLASDLTSSSGALAKQGLGTLTLAGTNTYAGGTFLYAGTLEFTAASALGPGNLNFWGGTLRWGTGVTTDLSGRFNAFENNATFDTNGNDLTFAHGLTSVNGGTIPGAHGLTKTGAGNLTLAGANTYAGTTTIAGGTLTLGDGATLGPADIINHATFAVDRSTDLTLANNISGSGGLTKAGTGTLLLTGTNTYTGVTAIDGGTLALAHPDALYGADTARWTDSQVTIASGAALALDYSSGAFSTAQINTILSQITPSLTLAFADQHPLNGDLDLTPLGESSPVSLSLTGTSTLVVGPHTLTAAAIHQDITLALGLHGRGSDGPNGNDAFEATGNGFNGTAGGAGGHLVLQGGTATLASAIDFSGGNGGNGGAAGSLGSGGFGGLPGTAGTIMLNGGTTDFAGDITLNGGRGGSGGGAISSSVVTGAGASGATGGSLTATGGTLTTGGQLTFNGGDGGAAGLGAASTNIAGAGGAGGTITLTDADSSFAGSVRLNGGNSTGSINTSAGGAGGAVALTGGTHSWQGLELNGGSGSSGGLGGALTLTDADATFHVGFSLVGGGGLPNGGSQGGSVTIDGGTTNVGGGVSLQGGIGGGQGGTMHLVAGAVALADGVNLNGGAAYTGSGFATGRGGHGGNLIVDGGTADFAGAVLISGHNGGHSSQFTFAVRGGDGGSLVVNGGHVTVSGGLFLNGGEGGSGYRDFLSGNWTRSAAQGGAGGSINITGGTLSWQGGQLSLAGGPGGVFDTSRAPSGATGTLTLSGGNLVLASVGQLDNPATFAGNFSFAGGTLRFTDANNAIDAGGVLANALGGTLPAGRTLAFDHAATFNTDLTVAAGAGLSFAEGGAFANDAALTLADGATLRFGLGTTATPLSFASGTTLQGITAGTVTIDLFDAGGFTAGTYDLIDGTAATFRDFDITDFAVGNAIPGYAFNFSLSGHILQVTASLSAVPEPSTYALLLGLALLGFALHRRRRN